MVAKGKIEEGVAGKKEGAHISVARQQGKRTQKKKQEDGEVDPTLKLDFGIIMKFGSLGISPPV